MIEILLSSLAKWFLGKGIDKKFPALVAFYKKLYCLITNDTAVEVIIPLNGKLLVSKRDTGLGLFLRIKGEFEPMQTNLFLEKLNKGDIVFDIGANIGYYTILASKKIREKGNVFAFEPDPQNIKLLRHNIKINACSNVSIVEAALGRKEEKIALMQNLSNPGESQIANNKKGKKVIVDLTTLDNFANRKRLKKVNIVKIDVEGFETEILEGGKNILANSKSAKIFIECNPKALAQYNASELDLVQKLQELGFIPKLIINEFKRATYPFSYTALNNSLNKASYISLLLSHPS